MRCSIFLQAIMVWLSTICNIPTYLLWGQLLIQNYIYVSIHVYWNGICGLLLTHACIWREFPNKSCKVRHYFTRKHDLTGKSGYHFFRKTHSQLYMYDNLIDLARGIAGSMASRAATIPVFVILCSKAPSSGHFVLASRPINIKMLKTLPKTIECAFRKQKVYGNIWNLKPEGQWRSIPKSVNRSYQRVL